MRHILGVLGFVLLAQGVSGAINQWIGQPFMGVLLNLFDRLVVENLAVLEGREIFANLALAAVGVVVIIAAERAPA